MSPTLPLPELPEEALAHESRMRAHLRALAADAGGALTFEQFMEAALFAPGLGYYSAGARKLGAAGDFVTAPEISPLFGRCVARNVAAVLAGLDGGAVLEIGAGSGSLAAQVLGELARRGAPAPRYQILERSADLRERQRAALAGWASVEWLDELPARGLRGVVLANEVLDALPAIRFRIDQDGVSEEVVRLAGEALETAFEAPRTACLAPRVAALRAALPEPLAPGYVSEIAPAREAWVASVAEVLEQGVIVVLDYGYPRREYYHPQRAAGTLRCHLGHRAHDDPLAHPGVQDVSVHVEFTAIAEAAHGAGLEVAGFTTQAEFLLASGLLELIAEHEIGSEDYLAAAGAVRTLTLPSEMGEAVKVLALARGAVPALPGFAGRDHRARL